VNRVLEQVAKFLQHARGRAIAGMVLLVVAGGVLWGSCRKTDVQRPEATTLESQEQVGQLFQYAVQTLAQIDHFAGGESFVQAVNRLDQWVQTQKPLDDWQADPMAAPYLSAMAEIGERVKPVSGQLSEPRYHLELKLIARQLQTVPEQFEALTRRRSLGELESLSAAHEQAIRAIEEATKRGGDPTSKRRSRTT